MKRDLFRTFIILVCTLSFQVHACCLEVKTIRVIKKFGKSVDWSHKADMIVSARKGPDGYYDIFTMSPKGKDVRYLTRKKTGCPQKHNGNPAWHPSADFIIFTAQNPDASGKNAKKFGIPGTGINCNLWLMDKGGERFWQLTHYPTKYFRATAVIHPQFSRDGNKVVWAQRLGPGIGGTWGRWTLKIADFHFENGTPSLANVRTLEAGKRHAFFEAHDFSPHSDKILFSANIEKGQPENGIDIYEMDLKTQRIRNLTQTTGEWDEHAHYSPDGKYIAWMSSAGIPLEWGNIKGHSWQKVIKTELWIMDADGTNKKQLTHFNRFGHPHNRFFAEGKELRCIVSDTCWNGDGTAIIAAVAWVNTNFTFDRGVKLLMIELK